MYNPEFKYYQLVEQGGRLLHLVSDVLHTALETFHSTSKQAAKVAKAANAGKLLLGHFSARYENLNLLLDEAREIFTESYLAEEGKTFSI